MDITTLAYKHIFDVQRYRLRMFASLSLHIFATVWGFIIPSIFVLSIVLGILACLFPKLHSKMVGLALLCVSGGTIAGSILLYGIALLVDHIGPRGDNFDAPLGSFLLWMGGIFLSALVQAGLLGKLFINWVKGAG